MTSQQQEDDVTDRYEAMRRKIEQFRSKIRSDEKVEESTGSDRVDAETHSENEGMHLQWTCTVISLAGDAPFKSQYNHVYPEHKWV